MGDIFGLEARNYEHLAVLEREGLLQNYLRGMAQEAQTREHDFNVINGGMWGSRSTVPMHARAESNTQALGFLTNNLQAIQAQMQEILYTELRYPEFIPIITDIPEGATSWADRVMDWAGEGAFIEQEGTSVPSATVAQRLETYPLQYAGIAGKWTIEGVRQAMMAGIPLSSETVKAAARGAANHIEQVGFSGWDAFSWKGLVNLPITGDDAVTHNDQGSSQTITDDLSSEEIRKLMTDEMAAMIIDTQEVVGRTIQSSLVFYLPLKQFIAVTTDPIGDNVDKSIWAYVLRNNPWTTWTGQAPMIKPLQELSGAGTGGDDRMITTIMSEQIFGLPIPIMPRVTNSGMEGGYTVCTYFEYKMGPLVVRRPTLIRYRDKI